MSGSIRNPISVIIPTKDEERNIADCIKSVSWCGEIIVYDSISSDHTIEIAQRLGANIVQRSFDNFATHKNWALDNIPFKHEWILLIDADERVTSELRKEINIAREKNNFEVYYIPRKNLFRGKWIRHGGWFPDYQLRFFRRGSARYEERIVHEHMVIEGQAGYLQQPLIHHDFKGLERYFERHNTYSSMEAVEAFNILNKTKNSVQIDKGLQKARSWRRRGLKEFAYRFLPCRALVKFLWMYVFKCGFLDGRMGFRYCLLHAFYEYQVSLKLEELVDPDSPMHKKYRHYLASDM